MPFKKIKTDSSWLPLHLEAAWRMRCNLCLLHTACFLLLPHCLIPTYTIVASCCSWCIYQSCMPYRFVDSGNVSACSQ
ncbi:hypothetical protein BT96DRAFT_344464 [Gymnopus androsaceus JB14]|uniref:Uncharacterized protein n=1 Tax=Gymnopus androsaceus JB14 TaxID=1447944 RepID=A0A6A4GZA2_9AGAR|nr:hypothetical protein BT96DRAFT_344464 [Gymnopus androsaceus JB14]